MEMRVAFAMTKNSEGVGADNATGSLFAEPYVHPHTALVYISHKFLGDCHRHFLDLCQWRSPKF